MSDAREPAVGQNPTDGEQDVLSAVRRKYDDLTHSQKRIAEAIVEDPEFVAFATVDKLAERLSIAPSTVVRFAYKIGLNGYPDLQERVRKVVRSQMRTRPQGGDADIELAGHLEPSGQSASLLHDLDNLRQTISGLDADRITEAIEAIASARNVFVLGGYASGALSAYTALTLERIRGQAYLIESHGGRHIPALFQGGKEDVVLAFGFAPYSADTVQLLEVAKERGIRGIGITDTPISPIGQRVDIVLAARVSGMGAQNSLVAPLAIVNALLNGATAAIPTAIGRYEQMMRSMDDWGLFVLSSSDTK
ncbi:MAG TPA: MurR/RpiR family transcriptional regulator [Pseudolysinimonas sp.]|jgi:DNA-binding MurR/RpiR family transcriptional regulator